MKRLNSEIDGVYNLPTTLANIPPYAFYGNSQLTDVIVGRIVSIDDYAFSGCKLLSKFNSENNGELIVPDGVTSIGDYVFLNLELITKVVVPETVENIGQSAFDRMISLEELTIPYINDGDDKGLGYMFSHDNEYNRGIEGMSKTVIYNSNYSTYYYVPITLKIVILISIFEKTGIVKDDDCFPAMRVYFFEQIMQGRAFYRPARCIGVNKDTDNFVTVIGGELFTENDLSVERIFVESCTPCVNYSVFHKN